MHKHTQLQVLEARLSRLGLRARRNESGTLFVDGALDHQPTLLFYHDQHLENWLDQKDWEARQ